MLDDFWCKNHLLSKNWELIVDSEWVTGAYIYSRATHHSTIIPYIKTHPYFIPNASNYHIIHEVEKLNPTHLSIAICIKTKRIKLIISEIVHLKEYLSIFWNTQNMRSTIQQNLWMISIDFSEKDPWLKIYYKVKKEPFLPFLPKSHHPYIEHILIKEDITKILPWRNKKIYFKYGKLPMDSFFEKKFPILQKTGILKPNYYAIQPENWEESLYYFLP
jgi:hypothetical protein